MASTQRFMVKTSPGVAGRPRLRLNGDAIQFRATPLFESIGTLAPPHSGDKKKTLQATAAPAAPTWHIVESALGLESANPWDVCHAMVSQRMGLQGAGAVMFAEPDIAQEWLTGTPEEHLVSLTESCTADPQESGPGGFPGGTQNDWYRDQDHSQLELLSKSATGQGVRIAHLDTGYDPTHASKPEGLEEGLAKNFLDDDRPNDATDQTTGLWNNRGHGTGTLSLLAGKPVPLVGIAGVAPKASVVPIRVANRVALFQNSAIARALDHVHKLCQSPQTFVDVLSMSMGGLASQAWAEGVNALYDAGVFVVTAAGNNYNNFPTRNIVYPARFNRVVAACGVMADFKPYADLGPNKMAGNYGPKKKMRTAMAAFTPNIPWARFGCPQTVRFNGAGTSSATPQIAGTAALYFQAKRADLKALPEPWMRVEAVRQALFKGADSLNPVTLGNGVLKAKAVLARPVPAASQLQKEEPDSASFAFLRVLTGLGMQAADSPRQQMLELEALQLSQSAEIERLLPDPEDVGSLTDGQKAAIARALAQHPRASQALKDALANLVPQGTGRPPIATVAQPATEGMVAVMERSALGREYPVPSSRRLRIYSYDPSFGESVDTVGINEVVVSIPWETELGPGPVGEYLEVVDVDPASGRCYAPVDLNDPRLLASDGLRPSEANPQFHQQMVYAVAMKTIQHFERALGRRALWAPRFVKQVGEGGKTKKLAEYVQRLRIYPHALRAQNAYYSPEKKALLLGYFKSDGDGEGSQDGEQMVFTSLSSDIIAHETTHALLDGLHRRFREPTNPDVLAFHEAFADIVALFQHFSLEGALRDEIARSRGNLAHDNLLSKLAVQFGKATHRKGALRDAIGKVSTDEQGKQVWTPKEVNKKDYQTVKEPHDRGSLLVGAVFDAFLQIYRRKALRPIRLATGGSEVLAPGALQADLADALAEVASSVARQVLQMCIRALDYCPPVDITFGDFLRAVITADRDLVPDDPHGYRVAFASAFRARGIYPESVRTVSVDTLTWEPPPAPLKNFARMLPRLSLRWDLQTQGKRAWDSSRHNGGLLHTWLTDPKSVSDEELTMLGLHRHPNPDYQLKRADGSVASMDLRGIEVHSVRPVRRVGPDGQMLAQLVIELTQSLYSKDGDSTVLRGGCTLIADLSKAQVTYMVRKRLDQATRVERQYAMWASTEAYVADIYRGANMSRAEPFALLHGVH